MESDFLSMSEEIILQLKKGPRTPKELLIRLFLSEKTFYKKIADLEREGRILVFPLRERNRWTSLYCLPEHKEVAATISGFDLRAPVLSIPSLKEIEKTIEKLRFKFQRNPDVEEIILEIKESPENPKIRDEIYKIGSRIGWRPPTSEEREEAKKELSLILKVASKLKKGEPPLIGFGIEPPKALLKKAKEYLRRFPELIP
jgi:hypothetical protein